MADRPAFSTSPPTPPAPRRQWPLLVLCLALLVALVVVALVKACPPDPVPAGKPATDVATTDDVKAVSPVAPVPEDSKAGEK